MIPTPNRRWFRFSLRTLLIAVTVLGVGLGWFAWNLHQIRARKDIISYIRRGAGHRERQVEPRSLPVLWRLMGEPAQSLDIELPRERFSDAERRHLQSLYPEVDVHLVDRPPRMIPEPQDVDYAEAHWDD